MSEWWTYTLGDFLMFSPATYWRLVESYNRDVWPAQLVGLVAGFAACGLTLSQRCSAARVQALLLAAAFLWVGWAFFWQRYAAINWAANYFAFAFWAQAALLVGLAGLPTKSATGKTGTREAQIYSAWRAITWLGRSAALVFLQISRYLLQKPPCIPSRSKRRASTRINPRFPNQKIGWLLALAGLVIYPLGSAWHGKTWSQTEVFGVSPEPTALVCLGLLLARPMQTPQLFRWVLAIIPSASLLVSAATLRAMAQI